MPDLPDLLSNSDLIAGPTMSVCPSVRPSDQSGEFVDRANAVGMPHRAWGKGRPHLRLPYHPLAAGDYIKIHPPTTDPPTHPPTRWRGQLHEVEFCCVFAVIWSVGRGVGNWRFGTAP